MKLEDIFTEWEQDSRIDRSELGDEVLRIPRLHHKYFKIFTNERLILRKYEVELKQLKLAKHEFFTMGPTEETHARGWQLPPQGKVLRSDLNYYVEADNEVVNLTLKIGIQQEKLELLESIIKSLTNRGFNIKSAIDWEKFKVGI